MDGKQMYLDVTYIYTMYASYTTRITNKPPKNIIIIIIIFIFIVTFILVSFKQSPEEFCRNVMVYYHK